MLFPALSRWSMVVALGAFPYARGQGLGSPFHQGMIIWPTAFAGVTAVGLLIGLMLVGIERGCREVFPDYLSAAVLVSSLIAVNRGLHLDGLMDTFDGVFGGYDPERRLEIMRDSQVGAFGIAAAIGVDLHQGVGA